MRLAQMARKLNVSQAEIVRHLSGQNMPIEESSNVKLEEKHIRSLYSRFAPAYLVEVNELHNAMVSPAVVPPSVPFTDAGESGKKVETTESEELTAADRLHGPIHVEVSATGTDAPQLSDKTDVSALSRAATDGLRVDEKGTIRVPKIELAGLKVLGKIDLPEAKKKDTLQEDAITQAASSETGMVEDGAGAEKATSSTMERNDKLQRERYRTENEQRRPRSKPRDQRSINPVAAARERELEEERERRKQKAAADKERRTQNYQKRVTPSQPTKAARMVEEEVEQMSAAALDERPTTWLGKFMKWLRT